MAASMTSYIIFIGIRTRFLGSDLRSNMPWWLHRLHLLNPFLWDFVSQFSAEIKCSISGTMGKYGLNIPWIKLYIKSSICEFVFRKLLPYTRQNDCNSDDGWSFFIWCHLEQKQYTEFANFKLNVSNLSKKNLFLHFNHSRVSIQSNTHISYN